MKILGLDWVGTRTSHFRETVAFFEQILGLPVGKRQDDFVRLDLPDSSVVEVFGPGDEDHLFFTTGPAVGFLVGDIREAVTELAGEGIELLGPTGGEGGDARWQHFRAPDGCVYEVVENPNRQAPREPVGPLQITRLAWVGTRTAQYNETRSFFGRFMALGLVEELPDLAEYGLPDGSTIEVFRPGAAVDFPQFSTGPVPGFGVEDIDVAVAALRSRKIPLIQTNLSGPVGWAHFRVPDGCVYEVQGPRRPD
ncbi:MAG: VOC family protein [Thermoplasmata archaeon]|nr:VOC family protein [Thermoplasmata archaeon]